MDDKQKQRSLQRIVRRIVQNERLKNKYNAFKDTAIQVTRSFDQEVAARQKEQEQNIADAFQKMIRLSRSLELENEEQLAREEERSRPKEKRIDKVKRKVPRRIRSFPAALKRNPRAVIKYFLGVILGRVLAIVLYILMTFIPSLPIPDSVANMSKPPEFFDKALSSMRNFFTDSLSSMRSFFTDFNPQMIVTSIPADINKLIQTVGEFFTSYAKRASAFVVKAIRHPRLALEDTRKFFHGKAQMLIRLARAAVSVAVSFIMIKLAMIFLLPLFGGIAVTILGIKVSTILFVIARTVVDKIGELLGKRVVKTVREILDKPIIKPIVYYLREKIFGKS